MTGLDELLNFNATALQLRSQRQEILAANIANADTPNFKARDIDFKSAMQKAIDIGSTPNTIDEKSLNNSSKSVSMATTSAKHLGGDSQSMTPVQFDSSDLLYRSVVQDSVDGNTVDPDVERSAFINNAIHYEANVMLINASLKEMNLALQP